MKGRPNRVFGYEQVVSIARSVPNPRDRALFAIEFLTGARTTEIVGRLRKDQLVKRYLAGEPFLVVEELYTAKKPKHSSRKNPRERYLPIPISRDGDLISLMQEYLDSKSPDDVLFDISRQRAWQIISRIVSRYKEKSDYNRFMNANHFLRHCRNTDLIIRYNFTDADLRKWNNWSSTEPARAYEHLRTVDLARKMIA